MISFYKSEYTKSPFRTRKSTANSDLKIERDFLIKASEGVNPPD